MSYVMSYTMTMEPEVRRGAEAYAARRGMTLEGVINAYLIVIAKRAEDRVAERRRPSFMRFCGSLPHEAAEEIRSVQSDFEKIDEEMWK